MKNGSKKMVKTVKMVKIVKMVQNGPKGLQLKVAKLPVIIPFSAYDGTAGHPEKKDLEKDEPTPTFDYSILGKTTNRLYYIRWLVI